MKRWLRKSSSETSNLYPDWERRQDWWSPCNRGGRIAASHLQNKYSKSNISKVRVRLKRRKPTLTGRKLLKRQKLRNNEYYDMQSVFDELYENSLAKCEFKNLISIITAEENIRLAYRNLKRMLEAERPVRMGKPSQTLQNEWAGTDWFCTAKIQLVSAPVCQTKRDSQG